MNTVRNSSLTIFGHIFLFLNKNMKAFVYSIYRKVTDDKFTKNDNKPTID